MTSAPPLLVEITDAAPEGWDAFVERTPGGTFCHLSGWGGVFDDALGLAPRYGVARRDGALEGVLPLVRMPRLGVGHELVSMPYLNYGGPIGSREARQALTAAAVAEAQARRDRRLELRCRADSQADLAPGREKVTVLLDLPDEPDTLFTDVFRSKLRSQIRRPMKEEMEVRFGAEQREPFYEVFAVNMRDLGTPVLPARLFEAIAERLGERVDFGVVYHEGRAVAAGCGFHFGDEFEMTWASSLRDYNRMSPNMLLYWAFMERSIERGRDVFNFGRCTPGGGTHRFKSQWESRDEPLHWTQWPEGAGGADPESPVFRKATELWSKLPLGVANAVGPKIARRIPTF